MERYKVLEAFIGERKVGTLALYKGRLVAFEYNEGWLREGFSISPFSLPLQKKVFIPKPDPFDGLFGAFADSLPDGWGRLLVDRMLNREHVDPHEVDMLNRLAIVGDSGMGALTYHPALDIPQSTALTDLDELSAKCHAILNHEDVNDLDSLFRMGGSSGGQREFAPVLARAAVAVGVAAVFTETHENPDKALSDGPNTIALKDMKGVLEVLKQFDEVRKRLDIF